MRITFIGGGNMAAALIGGLRRNGTEASGITVVEKKAERCTWLTQNFGVAAGTDLSPQACAADVLMLCVKPQGMADLARALAPRLEKQLVVSIAAGIRTADLARWLGGYERIVRVMPNTPAMVGRGLSGLYATPAVSEGERAAAASVLGAVGQILWVGREEGIDAVTAISGSGPAYVFYLMEALQDAARQLGFDEAAARVLVLATFDGAVTLAAQSGEDLATLRQNVTSKGGTTERALGVLQAGGMAGLLMEAARAADARAKELADLLGRQD